MAAMNFCLTFPTIFIARARLPPKVLPPWRTVKEPFKDRAYAFLLCGTGIGAIKYVPLPDSNPSQSLLTSAFSPLSSTHPSSPAQTRCLLVLLRTPSRCFKRARPPDGSPLGSSATGSEFGKHTYSLAVVQSSLLRHFGSVIPVHLGLLSV